MADQADGDNRARRGKTDAEKAEAVDRAFREAGFEFVQEPVEEGLVSMTFIVAPLLRDRLLSSEADEPTGTTISDAMLGEAGAEPMTPDHAAYLAPGETVVRRVSRPRGSDEQ